MINFILIFYNILVIRRSLLVNFNFNFIYLKLKNDYKYLLKILIWSPKSMHDLLSCKSERIHLFVYIVMNCSIN